MDLCLGCNVPDRDYDPDDDSFFCSDCACFSCLYLHCCEGQCSSPMRMTKA